MAFKSGDFLTHPIASNRRAIGSGFIVLLCSGAAVLASPSSLTATVSLPTIAGQAASQPLLIPVQARGDVGFRAHDLSGQAGQPLPFKIELAEGGIPESGQLFVFTGIPEGVTLSPGGDFGDFWAVNASVIKNLTLTAREDFSGKFKVWITRSREQSASARSASVTVTISPATAAPATVSSTHPLIAPGTLPTAAAAPTFPEKSGPAAPTPAARRSAPANEQMLMARANESFKKGDVSGARVIYEYLALQGSPAAAMAMGESYDPQVLGKLVVKGLDPDTKKARQWYEKAEQLGNIEARNRLNAMAAR